MLLTLMRSRLEQADLGRRPRGWVLPLGLSALVLIYANGLAWLAGPRIAEPNAVLATGNLFTVPLLLVAVIAAYRRRWPALGLVRSEIVPGLGLGFPAGVAMAAPALVVFALPPLMGEPLRWSVAADMSDRDVLLRLAFHLTISTAMFEELLFRGVLWDLFRRVGGTVLAWLATSAVFALWHVVLTVQSVGQTNVPPYLAPLAVVLGLGGVFGGGLVFGALRLLRGLAAPVAAHWAIDAVMLLALLARER